MNVSIHGLGLYIAMCFGAVAVWSTLNTLSYGIEIGEWRKSCFAANWKSGKVEIVTEGYVRPPPVAPWFALTQRNPDGTWKIIYNITQIRANGLTIAAQKFVFFHECAHATSNSNDEANADCEGLRAMHEDSPVTDAMLKQIEVALLRLGRRFPSGPCPNFHALNK